MYETSMLVDDALLLLDNSILLCYSYFFGNISLFQIVIFFNHVHLFLLENSHHHLRFLLEKLNLSLSCVLFERYYGNLMLFLQCLDGILHIISLPERFLSLQYDLILVHRLSTLSRF